MRVLIGVCYVLSMLRLAHAADLIPQRATPPIEVYITVDWEGDTLEPDNIAAMQQFRQRFPTIPLLQLLNPAYFFKPGADANAINATIRSTLLPIDTLGLHLHGWQHWVAHCGVTFQSQPQFAAAPLSASEAGVTVSLEHAYSQAALTQLIGCASQWMVGQGYPRPRHFRAGGWQLGPKLTAALDQQGFVWDSSVIQAALLTTRWPKDSALVTSLHRLHPQVPDLAQPYALTPSLKEYPNNAGLADYATSQQWVQLFEQLIASEHSVMVLGFHQESADDFLTILAQVIPRFEAIAAQHQRRLRWMP